VIHDRFRVIDAEAPSERLLPGPRHGPRGVDERIRHLRQLRQLRADVPAVGIDWRAGERYFAERLLDYDLAANNGGWQWCASTGCDAQPWFRILNPVTQSKRFDRNGRYIRSQVPELSQVPDAFIHAPWTMPVTEQKARGVLIGRDYPGPIVNHAEARVRTLARYALAGTAHRASV